MARRSRASGTSLGRARRRRAGGGDDAEAIREAALRILERVRRTRAELRTRLRERGYDAVRVDEVLERLGAVGLVDDVEYARAFLAGRWSRRMAGWAHLERELRRRGVSGRDIAAARARLESERGAVDDVAAARRVLAQAARRYAKLEPRLRRRRLYALLARRGFDADVIEEALRRESGSG